MKRDIVDSADIYTIARGSVECADCGRIMDEEADSEKEVAESIRRNTKGWLYASSKEFAVEGWVCPECMEGDGEVGDWKVEP